MLTNSRINILKKEIEKYVENFLDELLLLCESEIEKQLFLCFLNYIFNDIYIFYPFPPTGGFRDQSSSWKITNVGRDYDYFEWLEMNEIEKEFYTSKGYKFYGSDLVKITGIRFIDKCIDNDFYIEYILSPQFEVSLQNKYRLDFALLGAHYNKRGLIKKSKISIECDGLEFHNTKEHLERDKKRDRDLQLNGWKIYRMSGSEIYQVNTMEKIKSIFNDMRILSCQ